MSKQTTDGVIAFCIQVKIEASTMREWEPERIKAFFDGIAKAEAAARGDFTTPAEEP